MENSFKFNIEANSGTSKMNEETQFKNPCFDCENRIAIMHGGGSCARCIRCNNGSLCTLKS